MTTASCRCVIHTFLCCPTAWQLDQCRKCSVSEALIEYGNQSNGAYIVIQFFWHEVWNLNIRRIVATNGAGVMLVEQVPRCYMTLQVVQ
jgi:hypothetical protein